MSKRKNARVHNVVGLFKFVRAEKEKAMKKHCLPHSFFTLHGKDEKDGKNGVPISRRKAIDLSRYFYDMRATYAKAAITISKECNLTPEEAFEYEQEQ